MLNNFEGYFLFRYFFCFAQIWLSSSIYDLIFLASRVRKIATSCRRYKADREEWRDSYHWSPIYLGSFFPALSPPRQKVSVGCRACTLERQRKERKMRSADDMGISQRHLPLALSLGLWSETKVFRPREAKAREGNTPASTSLPLWVFSCRFELIELVVGPEMSC